MARGPTRPLPSDTYADAYAFTLAISAFWTNPIGRNFTWSNATGTFSSDQRQALFTAELNSTQLQRQRDAFDVWESYLDCSFTEVADAASNNIRVGQYDTLDDDLGFVGYALRFTVGGSLNSAALYYDPALIDGLPWRERTYIHEIGHILNLAHPNASDQGSGALLSNPVMETGNSQRSIQPGDIIGAQHVLARQAALHQPYLMLFRR